MNEEKTRCGKQGELQANRKLKLLALTFVIVVTVVVAVVGTFVTFAVTGSAFLSALCGPSFYPPPA